MSSNCPSFFAPLALATALLVCGGPAFAQGEVDDEGSSHPTAGVITQPRVLVTDTTGDLQETEVLITNLVAARLSRFVNLKVIAQRDIKERLGLEADKQLAGCESNTTCIAELAGAFDVDLVAVSAVGRLGGTTVFTLQLVDEHGEAKARGTATVSALDDLAAAVSDVTDTAGRTVTGDEPKDVVVAAVDIAPAVTVDAGLKTPLLIGGGVAVGVGVVASAIGSLPLLAYNSADRELSSLRTTFIKDGDPAILADAADTQERAEGARRLYNNAAIYGVWGGAVVAGAGAGAVAAALLLFEDAP